MAIAKMTGTVNNDKKLRRKLSRKQVRFLEGG